jgi:thiamine-phosphate pyrophosphorylase
MDARKGRPALGLAALGAARRAAAALPKPADLRLYALGGVRAENAAECITAGADGVAVIGAALDGTDPRPLLGALGILAA